MTYTIKVRNDGFKSEIFDPVRKIWVIKTPEEEVRQKFILYLLNVKKIPLSHISVEHGVLINGTMKRYDIVVFDENLKPYLVVECKAPEIKLTQKVLDQAGRYNSALRAPFICITNGLDVKFFSITVR